MRSRSRISVLLSSLLALWLSGVSLHASANDLEDGMQALQDGNAAQAIKLWRPLAEAGDIDAQFGLGVIYNDAMGVEQDYAEANYWFLRAAEQGYAPAQFNLGNAYKNGNGMAVDPAMAVRWWRKAAEQNFTPAQFNLGSAYIEGVGVPRDRAAGLKWYRKAAANGHPQAQQFLERFDTAAKSRTEKSARAPAPAIPVEKHSEPAIEAPTHESTAAATASAPARPSETANCTDWLDRDANTHTVQLMASQDEADVQAYIAQHSLTDTAICHYKVKGSFWYGLMYGRYDSAANARAALVELPAALRAGGGYVRRIAELRRAVNAR